MLFCMLAPSHYGSINVVTVVVFAAVALLAIWGAINTSYKVGQSV